jgi:hypothetical protein
MIQKDSELLSGFMVEETEWMDNEVDFDETHEYVVIAIFDDGCEAASDPLSVTVVWDAVQENQADFGLYPNPAKETLCVEGIDIQQVEIFNMMGQSVLKVKESFNEIHLGNLSNGIYFVRLQTKQSERNLKLLIEK